MEENFSARDEGCELLFGLAKVSELGRFVAGDIVPRGVMVSVDISYSFNCYYVGGVCAE